MPFGNAKFTCPAKRAYGPVIVAILVAALAKHIMAEKWTLELYYAGSETGHELRGNEALIADRKTYEKMIIRKRENLVIKDRGIHKWQSIKGGKCTQLRVNAPKVRF